MRRMRDQVIADWLRVTVAESEVLEGLPPAGIHPRALPAPMPRELQRRAIVERRAAIQGIIAELGRVPSVREMSDLVAGKGLAGNRATISTDYAALGITSEWRGRSKPEDQTPETPGPLFSSTVCKDRWTPCREVI
jgi:hypothetical protein